MKVKPTKISYSGLNTFKNSGGRAWHLHYEKRLRSSSYKGAFILGDIMDDIFGKLSIDKDLDAAKALFRKRFKKYDTYLGKLDVLKSKKIEWSKTEGDPKDWLEKKADMAIESYFYQVLPHFKEVLAIQQYVKIENEHGDFIRGWADKIVRWKLNPEANEFIDEKGEKQFYHDPDLAKWDDKIILFDDKFSTMKYTVNDSEQLATYKEAPNIEWELDGAGYIVIPKKFRTRKQPYVPAKISIDTVDDDVVDSIFKDYEDTLTKIKLGDYSCNGNSCGRPFKCIYKKYCESGGIDTEGLVYVPPSKEEK